MNTIQTVILGLALGGVYSLMASGLTLIFGVMRIVNLAHGAFMILAAYAAYYGFTLYNIDPLISLFIVTPLFFFMGVIIYKAIYPRITGSPRFMEMTILLAFGMALILEGVMGKFFTGTYRAANPSYTTDAIQIGDLFVPTAQFYATIVSIVLLGLLWLYLNYTKLGYATRATMQNRDAAQIVGVNVERVSTISYGIGIAMAGASGTLISFLFTFFPNKHWQWIAILVSLIVLGGLGSFVGTLVSALSLAVLASLISNWLGPTWSPLTFFLSLFIVLLFRPQGLFGKKLEEE
jgi:branched-chain amino acid transport system permease protein